MPFSHSGQVSTIVGYLESVRPASILDVGAGMGQYGFLARVNLEGPDLFEQVGDRGRLKDRHEWSLRIVGIEGCTIYLNPVHAWAYDEMLVGDALEVLSTVADGSFEMVLAIDILEHFERDAGRRFLTELRRVASRRVLVSTPKIWIEQTIPANPLEDHRSLWTDDELAEEGFTSVLPDGASWVVAWAAGRSDSVRR